MGGPKKLYGFLATVDHKRLGIRYLITDFFFLPVGGVEAHAQSLKPNCLMPNLTQFSGIQLQDLVVYLRQLQ